MKVYLVRYVSFGGENGVLGVYATRSLAERALASFRGMYAFIDERQVET